MQQTRPQKIKVNVADLIDKIEAFKKKAIADKTRAEKTFEADKEKYAKRVVEVLEKVLAEAKTGKLPPKSYNGLILSFRGDEPSKPTLNISVIDADLSMLRMSAEDTIVIDHTSQWRQYLG